MTSMILLCFRPRGMIQPVCDYSYASGLAAAKKTPVSPKATIAATAFIFAGASISKRNIALALLTETLAITFFLVLSASSL